MFVYFERFDDMLNAITTEKRIRKWNRASKIKLIPEKNSNWEDLWNLIIGYVSPSVGPRLRGDEE